MKRKSKRPTQIKIRKAPKKKLKVRKLARLKKLSRMNKSSKRLRTCETKQIAIHSSRQRAVNAV